VRRRLVVWVEGDRDSRFVRAVLEPRLSQIYGRVVVEEYSRRERSSVNRLLQSLRRKGDPRLFIGDKNAAPCVANRKRRVREHYPDLDDREIVVVCREIESWYLAGLSTEGAAALRINPPQFTDHMSKEVNSLRPSRFETPLDFFLELLKHFDWHTACQRNKSFAYLDRMLK